MTMGRKKNVKFLPYEEIKKTYKKTDLTDNVKFNVFLSPLYFVLILLYLLLNSKLKSKMRVELSRLRIDRNFTSKYYVVFQHYNQLR
jgi:hypothetical protein